MSLDPSAQQVMVRWHIPEFGPAREHLYLLADVNLTHPISGREMPRYRNKPLCGQECFIVRQTHPYGRSERCQRCEYLAQVYGVAWPQGTVEDGG